jgi:hypothetical protein
VKVTTTITVAARFNRDGELMSGTIDETNQAADDQSPSSLGASRRRFLGRSSASSSRVR